MGRHHTTEFIAEGQLIGGHFGDRLPHMSTQLILPWSYRANNPNTLIMKERKQKHRNVNQLAQNHRMVSDKLEFKLRRSSFRGGA